MPQVIKVHKTFIEDILSHGDSNFARRIVNHLFDEYLGTSNNSNDHRYHGINGAWIRYLSRGSTGYRIIIIKNGIDSVFYRCGNHDVEDNLNAPNAGNEVIELEISEDELVEMTKPRTLLTNHHKPIMLSSLLGRTLIPHKEVFIISPFIETSLLFRGAAIGKMLDKLVRDGAEIKIITSMQSLDNFEKLHTDLSQRSIEVVFMPKLHSKIYLFLTNHEHPHHLARSPSLGVVGSSNLTKSGIPDKKGNGNYETNYSVSEESLGRLHDLAVEHYINGHEFKRAKQLFSREKKLRMRKIK